MTHLFSIPFHSDFITNLARYILRETDPLARAQKIVFLPTRQACLDVARALENECLGGSLLLPSLIPLGEADPDEVALSSQEGAQLIYNLPNLITPERRQLLLATLLMSYHASHIPLALDRAIDLSRDLMHLIDDMRSNNIPLTQLEHLDPHLEHAEHWHQILSFLKIISQHWDRILAEENVIESIPYLTRLRHHQIEQWTKMPPSAEVIIAGSQGTIHSTRQLMAALLTLPRGTLILNGWDPIESTGTYPDLSPTHPQYQHYDLLKKLGIQPSHIQELNEASRSPPPLHLYEAPNPGTEAQMIALHIRDSLDIPDQRILCVSADNSLLDRVAIELCRWNISVMPHRGCSLLGTPWGSFITEAAFCFQPDDFLTSFLGLIKHPFSSISKPMIIVFENALRQYGLSTSLEHIQKDIDPYLAPVETSISNEIRDLFKNVKHIFYNPSLSLTTKHRHLMAYILGTPMEIDDIESAIRHHESWDAEEAAQFLKSLTHATSSINLTDVPYGDVVRKLMEHVYCRPPRGNFKNIRLMTPSEARLLKADRIILGGMNEGSWPLKLTPDPLLSRGLRITLGLTPPERMIGQSAHDFMGCITRAPTFITRSIYTQGTPTAPSRFLVRLQHRQSPSDSLEIPPHLERWHHQLMRSDSIRPLSPPCPKPPPHLRPRAYSVTDIETLMHDPYSFYAKRVLNLPKLNPLNGEPSLRHFGIFIHAFLEEWIRLNSSMESVPSRHPGSSSLSSSWNPEEAIGPSFITPDQKEFLNKDATTRDTLPSIPSEAHSLFEKYFRSSPHKNFWWCRFLHVFREIAQHQSYLHPKTILTEVSGSMALSIGPNDIRVHGRADRMDIYPDGVTILDYKTGTPPRLSDIRQGLHPQLGIEAAFHLFGSFQNVPKNLPIRSIECWALGRDKKFEIIRLDIDPQELAIEMREGIVNLLSFFLKDTPYLSHPWGDFSERDYNHLSRVSEWKHH